MTLNLQQILVVEDDPSVRKLVLAVLSRCGADIHVASDGIEAIDHIRRSSYALVLLDLMLPNLDGYGVAAWISEHLPPSQRPLVIAVTASLDADLQRLDPAVVAGVLRKPFDVHELAGIVESCIAGPQMVVSENFPIDQLLVRAPSLVRVS